MDLHTLLSSCASLPIAYAAENPRSKPAEALYLQLGSVGLDTARVYQVRDASLDRAAIHISLEDGTIAFTQDVIGRVTGAFFEGEGEILLVPPNEVERKSMSLFTGMAILEERFATAYFRFNDDLMAELKPDLRDTGPQQEFLERTGPAAKNLANIDAMRLLTTFSHMLPSADGSSSSRPTPRSAIVPIAFYMRGCREPNSVFLTCILIQRLRSKCLSGSPKPPRTERRITTFGPLFQ